MSNPNGFALPQQPGNQTPQGYPQPQPPAYDAPQQYGEDYDDYDTSGAVYWSVEGWDPRRPFAGELVFTDEDGEVLVSLPLEPETMQSLNEITGAVLQAQYANLGVAPKQNASSPEEEPDAGATAERKTVYEKNIAGVPFRVSVNTKSLTALAVITVIVIGVLILGIIR